MRGVKLRFRQNSRQRDQERLHTGHKKAPLRESREALSVLIEKLIAFLT